ncbi:MAG: DUF1295 domain-containing protein [Candidatus Lokiarchaeota archaeon]|nr:DUF1295 domain-containing protein [Candidatus Lokiarchaeota archaeon]MBD3340802.1 DUF1295 domain-containing protein [Candidatus Lokiarchaeota archaeon]
MFELTYSQIFLLIYVVSVIAYYIGTYGSVEGKHERALTERYERTSLSKALGPIFSLTMLMWIAFSVIYFIAYESNAWIFMFELLANDFTKIVAIGIMSFSLVLSVLFVKSVGKSIKNAVNTESRPKLITTGIYHYIRHPVYTAILLGIFGTFLIIPNIIMLSFLIFMVLLLFLHSREEEKILIQMFGEEYKDYKKKTGRFLPKLIRK